MILAIVVMLTLAITLFVINAQHKAIWKQRAREELRRLDKDPLIVLHYNDVIQLIDAINNEQLNDLKQRLKARLDHARELARKNLELL